MYIYVFIYILYKEIELVMLLHVSKLLLTTPEINYCNIYHHPYFFWYIYIYICMFTGFRPLVFSLNTDAYCSFSGRFRLVMNSLRDSIGPLISTKSSYCSCACVELSMFLEMKWEFYLFHATISFFRSVGRSVGRFHVPN